MKNQRDFQRLFRCTPVHRGVVYSIFRQFIVGFIFRFERRMDGLEKDSPLQGSKTTHRVIDNGFKQSLDQSGVFRQGSRWTHSRTGVVLAVSTGAAERVPQGRAGQARAPFVNNPAGLFKSPETTPQVLKPASSRPFSCPPLWVFATRPTV